jgi:hypothetical protein
VGRRRGGKSDPIDAVRAARELLARPNAGQMRADGDRCTSAAGSWDSSCSMVPGADVTVG